MFIFRQNTDLELFRLRGEKLIVNFVCRLYEAECVLRAALRRWKNS